MDRIRNYGYKNALTLLTPFFLYFFLSFFLHSLYPTLWRSNSFYLEMQLIRTFYSKPVLSLLAISWHTKAGLRPATVDHILML